MTERNSSIPDGTGAGCSLDQGTRAVRVTRTGIRGVGSITIDPCDRYYQRNNDLVSRQGGSGGLSQPPADCDITG